MQEVDQVIKDCAVMHLQKEAKLRNSLIWNLQFAFLMVCVCVFVHMHAVENMEPAVPWGLACYGNFITTCYGYNVCYK